MSVTSMKRLREALDGCNQLHALRANAELIKDLELTRLREELKTNRRECQSSHVDKQVYDEMRQRMLRELLATLDRNFAQAISPADAWSEALIRVARLRGENEYLKTSLANVNNRYSDSDREVERLLADREVAERQIGLLHAEVEAQRVEYEQTKWMGERSLRLEAEAEAERLRKEKETLDDILRHRGYTDRYQRLRDRLRRIEEAARAMLDRTYEGNIPKDVRDALRTALGEEADV